MTDEFGGVTPMLTCRPKDPADYPTYLRDLWEKAMLDARTAGNPEPPVYPGSVDGVCAQCGITVLVGPRQMSVLEKRTAENKATLIGCIVCTTLVIAYGVGPHEVRNLGNPYLP
jgi:hypothetical protein